jgi:hypothetical protein
MRLLLVASLLTLPLASAQLAAQTLEESYAQLCSKPEESRTEACQVLAKSLVAKLQGQQGSPASGEAAAVTEPPPVGPELVGMERWGFFADLVDQDLIDIQYENPSNIAFNLGTLDYVWEVPGEVMVLRQKRADGTVTPAATMQWDATHGGLRETAPGGGASSLYEWQPDGSAIVRGGAVRIVSRRLADGALEMIMEGERGQEWQLMNRRHRVPATAANLKIQALMKQVEANMAEGQNLMAEIKRRDAELKASPLWQQTLINRANAEAERERKRQARANGGGFMAALNGMLDAGLEVAHAREAQSRYELDSTLANINSQIAAQQAQQGQVPQAASTPPVQAGIQPVKAPRLRHCHCCQRKPSRNRGIGRVGVRGGETPALRSDHRHAQPAGRCAQPDVLLERGHAAGSAGLGRARVPPDRFGRAGAVGDREPQVTIHRTVPGQRSRDHQRR